MRNAGGELIDPPQVIGERWASIEPLTGREVRDADQVRPDVTHKIKMRFDKQLKLTPKMSLRNKQTQAVYQIESARNIREYGETVVVMAKEEV